jgi:hypothetical protein
LLLHSTVFVYFGPSILWRSFKGNLGAGRLVACLVLILLSWRTPIGTGTEEIDLPLSKHIARHSPPATLDPWVSARSSSPSRLAQGLRRRPHVPSLVHQSNHQTKRPLTLSRPLHASPRLAQSWSTDYR